ncbi:hypothetical protein ABW19_dt0200193 [Dactylella cylindrospora]|nr:hypothetical protein ABW19_dt0200193 [Dactylella cylindrospora]
MASFRSGLSRVKDILPFGAGSKPRSIQPVIPASISIQKPQTVDQLLATLGTRKLLRYRDPSRPAPKKIKIHPAPGPSPPKNVLSLFTASKLRLLDPTGHRQHLFSRHNKDAILPGDILQIRFKDPNTEPFAGVLINIRRRGLDTAFLLRNHLTRVGVEMWYKLYSPKIAGIDLVQRKERRARRAKLYYLRKAKHDMGSVEGIVSRWKKSRMMFGGDQGAAVAGGKKAQGGKGKKK